MSYLGWHIDIDIDIGIGNIDRYNHIVVNRRRSLCVSSAVWSRSSNGLLFLALYSPSSLFMANFPVAPLVYDVRTRYCILLAPIHLENLESNPSIPSKPPGLIVSKICSYPYRLHGVKKGSNTELGYKKRRSWDEMVKVLENKIIDLDLLPGQAQIDLQRQFREQLDGAKTVTAGQLAQATGQSQDQERASAAEGEGNVEGQVQIPREMLPDSMSEEEKDRAKGVAGTIVDGSGKVVGGLAGTVGGVLKGVGDTGANVVSYSYYFR